MILDSIMNFLRVLVGILSFIASGRNLALVLIDYNRREHVMLILLDLFLTIWFFILGFGNIQAALQYFTSIFKRQK